MVSKLHFISGLPRSGSTLLGALLRQNPRFSARMTSPVASMCNALQPQISGGEYGVFFDDDRRKSMLRGIFNAYYANQPESQIIFDTNRTWTAKMALTQSLYPSSRVICCVRDTGWVIDSIERMLNKNPLQLSRIFNFKPGGTVYTRVDILMNSDTGLIGQAWSSLREAWFGELAQRLLVIPYENLTCDPKQVLQKLYAELDEPYFPHDFNSVLYDEPEFDAEAGMPGLHKVREKVEMETRMPSIPPDVFGQYSSANFWRKPELNMRGVKIL